MTGTDTDANAHAEGEGRLREGDTAWLQVRVTRLTAPLSQRWEPKPHSAEATAEVEFTHPCVGGSRIEVVRSALSLPTPPAPEREGDLRDAQVELQEIADSVRYAHECCKKIAAARRRIGPLATQAQTAGHALVEAERRLQRLTQQPLLALARGEKGTERAALLAVINSTDKQDRGWLYASAEEIADDIIAAGWSLHAPPAAPEASSAPSAGEGEEAIERLRAELAIMDAVPFASYALRPMVQINMDVARAILAERDVARAETAYWKEQTQAVRSVEVARLRAELEGAKRAGRTALEALRSVSRGALGGVQIRCAIDALVNTLSSAKGVGR